MRSVLPLLLALIPSLSFAIIGETKEDYLRYEDNTAMEMWYDVPNSPLLHNMKVRHIGHTGGMIGVGFDDQNRVAAEAGWDGKPWIFKQLETVSGVNPKGWAPNKAINSTLKKEGYVSYVSKDGRFIAYVRPSGKNPFTGLFLYEIVVGTKDFIKKAEQAAK